jgi:hypothetical protein
MLLLHTLLHLTKANQIDPNIMYNKIMATTTGFRQASCTVKDQDHQNIIIPSLYLETGLARAGGLVDTSKLLCCNKNNSTPTTTTTTQSNT